VYKIIYKTVLYGGKTVARNSNVASFCLDNSLTALGVIVAGFFASKEVNYGML
jgi:hypothetical protein